jgi:hypothetical protein
MMEQEREVYNGVPEQANAPLTPVGLRRLLEQQFDIYRKRESVAVPLTAAPGEQDLVGVDKMPGNQRQGFTAFFKKSYQTTSTYVKQMVKAKHLTVIQFVSEEMEDILRQDDSAVKKMTDLTILLHGLHYYITMGTHSQSLRPLLLDVCQRLWSCTKGLPISAERLNQYQAAAAVAQEIDANALKFLPEGADRRPYIVLMQRYIAQLRAASNMLMLEQIMFVNRYKVQIQQVYELLLNNATPAQKAEFAKTRSTPVTSYLANNAQIYNRGEDYLKQITNYDLWQYRSREVDQAVSPVETMGVLQEQRRESGLNDQYGHSLQRTWANMQLIVEMNRPIASMSGEYDVYLRDFLPRSEYTLEVANIANDNNLGM